MCCSLPSKLLSLSCSRRTISTYRACGKLRVVLFPISLEGREKKVKITDYQPDSKSSVGRVALCIVRRMLMMLMTNNQEDQQQ